MKSLIPALTLGVLVAVVCLAQSVSGQTWFVPPDPDVYWYNQTLDHFNSSDTRTFHQRYLVYDQYWKNYT
jgi:hypothetical protein